MNPAAAALLVAALAGPVALAVSARRRWVPTGGATALLATAVIACGAVIVGSELLAALGLFGTVGLLVLSAACLALAVALDPRAEDAGVPAVASDAGSHRLERWATPLALAAAAGVVAQWGARAVESMRHGVLDFDSLRYHLPNAVRLAQDGELLDPLFVLPDPTEGYHPLSSEILHAIPMAVLGSDALSPLLNLWWLALALLAGWCLGARAGLAPATLLATTAVLAAPIMAAAGGGTAKSDTASVALVLAAAALLVEAAGSRPPGAVVLVATGGLAAGLAVGSKYTVVVPVAALTIAVGLAGPSGAERWRRFAGWVGGAAVGGGFWVLRNLLASGNPLPSADLPLFESPDRPINEAYDYSILHYATDGRLWDDVFLPAWRTGFGRAVPLLALVMLAGLVATVVRADRRVRLVAWAGAAGLVGYLAVPLTAGGAEGHPVPGLVAANARYGAASLALCLCGTVMALGGLGRRAAASVTAVAAVAVVLGWSTTGPLRAWEGTAGASIVVGAAAVALVAVLPRLVPWASGARTRLLGGAVVAVLAVTVGANLLVDRYPRGRNLERPEDAELVMATEARPGTRFGVVGLDVGYLLVDHELRSSVRYLGVDAPHGGFRDATSCRELIGAVERHGVDVVVVAPARTDPAGTWPPAREWLQGLQGVTPLHASGSQALFEVVDSEVAAGACAGEAG